VDFTNRFGSNSIEVPRACQYQLNAIVRVRLTGEAQSFKTELGVVKEEMRIKDARMARAAPAHRPHYLPAERLAILTLKAARCWNNT
jgi:hypothetical protein